MATVYVYAGNLSWSVTDYDLQTFMVAAGDVRSARVARYADGRSKGWGLVEFVEVTSAQRAIAEFNDVELSGRKIFIREDRGGGIADNVPRSLSSGVSPVKGSDGGRQRKRGGRGRPRPPLEVPAVEVVRSTALFIGNLPWSTTSQQLRDVFSEYNVKSAVVTAGFDGRSRGYGIVTFESEEDAAAALALSGYNIDGREMLVRFDRAPPEV